jgi:hypothetical protein
MSSRSVARFGIFSTLYRAVVASAKTDMMSPTALPTRQQQHRFKSTVPVTSNPALSSWQLSCWSTYLSNGLGSDNLFRSIDLDHDNTISAEELKIFLESVHYKGVHPRAFKMLHELASDHGLNVKEFKSWLILATKFGNEKNSAFALDYQVCMCVRVCVCVRIVNL